MTSEPKLTAKALAEQAAKELAAAKAKSELLERKSAEASAKFQAEAEIRRQTFMRDWLEHEFVQAPEAEVARLATEAAFETAVQNDPLMQVWLAHLRATWRIGADDVTAKNFASQLGVTAPVSYPRAGASHFFEIMDFAIQRLASRLEGERTADIFDALEAAANGEGE